MLIWFSGLRFAGSSPVHARTVRIVRRVSCIYIPMSGMSWFDNLGYYLCGGIGRCIRLKIWFLWVQVPLGIWIYGLMLSVALIRLRLWVQADPLKNFRHLQPVKGYFLIF